MVECAQYQLLGTKTCFRLLRSFNPEIKCIKISLLARPKSALGHILLTDLSAYVHISCYDL